jgi:putative transcriptional regulator
VLEAIATGEGPGDFLVAMGYAGWGEGQLEQELLENAWLTCPGNRDILFRTPFAERVNKAAAALGIDFRLMSSQAGHA